MQIIYSWRNVQIEAAIVLLILFFFFFLFLGWIFDGTRISEWTNTNKRASRIYLCISIWNIATGFKFIMKINSMAHVETITNHFGVYFLLFDYRIISFIKVILHEMILIFLSRLSVGRAWLYWYKKRKQNFLNDA